MFEEELSSVVEGLCSAMKELIDKAGKDVETDQATRAEVLFFAVYLMSENDTVDWDELEKIEEAVGYSVDRSQWNEAKKIFRVDSEENYLSQPPETIDLMMQADNLLYDIGLNLECVDSTMLGYKSIGEIIVNHKGLYDEKRDRRLKKFVSMVEKYQYEHTMNPEYRKTLSNVEKEPVIPSKKGVAAPKKS